MQPFHRLVFVGLLVLWSHAWLAPPPVKAALPTAARTDADGNPLPEQSIRRLGSSRWRDGAALSGVQLSPDGKLIAYTTQAGDVELLSVATGREVRRLMPRGDRAIWYPVFSPDGQLVAALGTEKTVQIWEVVTGKLLHTLEGTERFLGIAFGPDGRFVVTSSGFAEKKARVWQLPSAKQIAKFDVLPKNGPGVALSRDGKILATWTVDLVEGFRNHPVGATVQIWDLATGKETRRLKAANLVTGAGFAPSGKEVVVDTLVQPEIFELASGKARPLRSSRGDVGHTCAQICFSPDGKSLTVVDPLNSLESDTFNLWDTATGKLRSLATGPCAANSVRFVGDQILACGVLSHAIRVWNAVSGKELTSLEGHCGAITSVAWNADGRTLVSADSVGRVCTWDASTGRNLAAADVCRARQDSCSLGIGLCTVAPDAKHVVANERGTDFVRVLGQVPREYRLDVGTRANYIVSAFASQRPVVVIAGDPICLCDLYTGRRIREFAHSGDAEAVALSADGRRVAAVYEPENPAPQTQSILAVRVWDAASGKLLSDFQTTPFQDRPYVRRVPLAFSADHGLLAVGENGAFISLWDPDSGKRLRSLGGAEGWQADALLVFPDRSTVAIGMQNLETGQGKVQLRELTSGSLRAEFTGHHGPVSSLTLSADGKILASGSSDTTVILWDLTSRAQHPPSALLARELERLWTELGSQDARRAYRAMWRLAASPQEAVAMLADKLEPEGDKAPSAADIARWIRQMDDERFATRERAAQELRRVGERARAPLEKTLARQPSPEMRRRIEGLLADLDSGRPLAAELQSLRAVEVLEHAGTPEARTLLQKLAAGRHDRAITQAAARAIALLSQPPSGDRSDELAQQTEKRDVAPDPEAAPAPAGAVARLGTTRLRTDSSERHARLACDGKRLVLIRDGFLRVVDVPSGKELRRLALAASAGATLAPISPDGRVMPISVADDKIRLWDLTTGKVLATLRGGHVSASALEHMAFSGDSGVLAAPGETDLFGWKPGKVWDVQTGKLLATLNAAESAGGVCLSPDGKMVATLSAFAENKFVDDAPGAETIVIRDVSTGKELQRMTVHSARGCQIAFSPVANELAVARAESVLLYNAKTGKQERSLDGPPHSLGYLQYSPDGKCVAAAGYDGEVVFWDPATGARRSRGKGVPGWFGSIIAGFGFAGDRVRTCALCGSLVRVWDVATGDQLTPFGGLCAPVSSLEFAPDSKSLLSADRTGVLGVWDVGTGRGELRSALEGRNGFPPSPDEYLVGVLTPDAKQLILRTEVRDVATGASTHELNLGNRAVEITLCAANGRVAVSIVTENDPNAVAAMCAWDLATGQMLHEVDTSSAGLRAAAITPDGALVAVLGVKGEVCVWEIETGKKRCSFHVSKQALDVAFCGGRSMIAALRDEAALGLWDAASGKCIRTLPRDKGWIPWTLSTSPDGRSLIVSSQHQRGGPGKLRVVEVDSDDVRAEFVNPDGPAFLTTFSPDGRLLASGHLDTTIVVWDLTGQRGDDRRDLSVADLEKLWADLDSRSGRQGYQAMWSLASAPRQAVGFLQGRVKPVFGKAPSEADLTRFIGQLSHGDRDTRARALRQLALAGDPAGPFLRKEVPSAETNSRADVERLLADLDARRPPRELLRELRAVETLERIGTPAARKLLRELSSGRPEALLTRDAQAALQRLEHQPR